MFCVVMIPTVAQRLCQWWIIEFSSTSPILSSSLPNPPDPCVENIPYEEKYWDAYDKSKSSASAEPLETSSVNPSNVLFERTPIGHVTMFYSADSESFRYYADHTIPYRYLEAVARRYVVVFKCTHLYIDMREELAKAALKSSQQEETKTESVSSSSLSSSSSSLPLPLPVFAKFKSYNTKTSIDSVVIPMKAANTTGNVPSTTSATNSTSPTSNDPIVLKERANRFSCEGRLNNFSFLKKPTEPVVQRLKVKFSEFKKKCLSQSS